MTLSPAAVSAPMDKTLSAAGLARADIFPERNLPDGVSLLRQGRAMADDCRLGHSAFLAATGATCEADYKRARMRAGEIMLHAQVGYRDAEKTRRACAEIHERLDAAGYRVDRYGICLDWSMGYPADKRRGRPRGTGLILTGPEDFERLTRVAPVAAHFGDFVIGMPAALENTQAALAAGATSIGNLGQYFTFRLPEWHDEIATTTATLRALALAAAQPVEVLIHSNLDDGFAALFRDMACSLGAVLIERHLVEDLIGGRVSHCYGHTFSDPLSRLAFQRALCEVSSTPGSMVYGNTTSYGQDTSANYAALATYLLVDIAAQRTRPSGHAINPVPVTEAHRIPDIDEIVDAHLFANRLIETSAGLMPLLAIEHADALAKRLVEGGRRFCRSVLAGLGAAGSDTDDPFELLLALRRIGARRLEVLFGPGAIQPGAVKSGAFESGTFVSGGGERRPVVPATTISELETRADLCVAALDARTRNSIAKAGFRACVATTDVHEYGKVLIESILARLGVRCIDAGVSTDPSALAAAAEANIDFVALSTYNGVALDYLQRLRKEMSQRGLAVPIFIGGRLNQIPGDSNSSLPVDVGEELRQQGAIPCRRPEDLLNWLAQSACGGDRR